MRRPIIAILFCLMIGITVTANTDTIQLISYVTVNYPDGSSDLHIMDVGTQETVYSMTTDRHDCPVSFSPDQQYLLYYQRFEQSGQWRNAYSLLNVATGNMQSVTDYAYDAIWSANSQHIAYSVPNHYNWKRNDIFVFDVQTGTEINVGWKYAVNNLRWADNTLYFFGAEDEDAAHRLYMWDGEYLTSILVDTLPLGAIYLSLSPDNQWLSYQSHNEQNVEQTYLVNLDTQVTTMLDITGRSYWSPDSDYIAILNRSNTIPIIDVHTQQIVDELTEDELTEDEYMFALSWSPDGSYLHYAYDGFGEEIYTRRIRNMQTRETVTLSQYTGAWATRQKWLSDTVLLYNYIPISEISETRNYEPESDLHLYDVLTGELTQLTTVADVNERLECFFG